MSSVCTLENRRLEDFLERHKAYYPYSGEIEIDRFLREILQKANEFVPSEAGSILLDDPSTKNNDDRSESDLVFIATFGGLAYNMRVMRGNLLDVLNAQYIETARAKGLRPAAVIMKHAVPNAMHTIVAYQGTVLPYMMAGELEAAIILGLPTLAPLFYQSLVVQDIYVSGSLLLIYGVLILAGNLLADIFLSFLDPRIRYS